MPQVPIVDTEFLFGLRSTDKKHGIVRQILQELERARPVESVRPAIPPVAVLELITVLLSEGKTVKEIQKVLELMDEIGQAYGLVLAGFRLGQVISGLSIYDASRIGLFDSLIAGAAADMDTEVIGDDPDFDIKGVKHLTFREYLTLLRRQA